MSGWMAGTAMTIGLGATAMDQFVESTDNWGKFTLGRRVQSRQ